MSRMNNVLMAKRPKEAVLLERLLHMVAADRSAFKKTLAEVAASDKLGFKQGTGLIEQTGIIDLDQLTTMMMHLQGPKTSIEILKRDAAIENCLAMGLLNRLPIQNQTKFIFQTNVISLYCSPNVLDNVICGRYYHLDKYQRSIVPVVVKRDTGDEAIGTGFFYTRDQYADRGWIITNKHVAVEGVQSIISMGLFTRIEDTEIRIHPHLDICAIEVLAPLKIPGLFFEKELILDEVVSLGFPSVAQSIQPAMLCHKGEVNGRVASYAEKGEELVVVSCHLAPGNSGGPLLNNAGKVLGVVCQSKIGKSMAEVDGIVTVHHVAIPGDTMDRFVREMCT